jgi:hypothetical protein
MKLKNYFFAAVISMASASLFAQTNFAGNWGLNESKSNFGEGRFRMAASAMTVTQNATTLTVESTMQNRDGEEMKTTAKYALDGSVSENPMFNSTRKSTAKWSADKSSLVIESTMTFDMGGETREMKSTETWKLSEGVLLIESVRPGRDGGEMRTTAAYDKK